MTISQLIQLKESEDKIEFKEAKSQYKYKSDRRSVLGYTVALANEGGGYLVFGITDKLPHTVCGSAAFAGNEGKLEQDVYSDLGIRISTEVLYDGSKRVLVIKVPPRPIGRPLYFEDVPLMRVGDRLERMSEDMYRSIIQEQEPDYSAKICDGLSIADLDPDAIKKMKEAYAAKQKNPSFASQGTEQVLNDLKLMVDGKLNNAALLLLGKSTVIEAKLPQAKTIWEFRFTEPQTPSDFREEICQPLFQGIDKLWQLINDKNGNIPVSAGAYIFNINAFNEEVIRESLLNAIAHRDYSMTSQVVIKQYPRKIIIINPGGFPRGVELSNLISVSSTPRSRVMAEVLEKTGLVERSGQGVDKIFATTLSEGKPEPDYRESGLYQVTLKLMGNIEDNAFAIFINNIQKSRLAHHNLGVEQIVALYKIKNGLYAEVRHELLTAMEKEKLIKATSGKSNRYTLADEYYDLADKQEKIGSRYLVKEVEHFVLALQGSSAAIGILETTLTGSLNRNQVKYLITKLYEDGIVTSTGRGKGTRYAIKSPYNSLRGDALVHEVVTQLRELYK